jgi:hypothetical protein
VGLTLAPDVQLKGQKAEIAPDFFNDIRQNRTIDS